MLTDDKVMELLSVLHDIATWSNADRVGLPLYDTEPQRKMISEVQTFFDHCIAQMKITLDQQITGGNMNSGVIAEPAILHITPAGKPIQPMQGGNSIALNDDTMRAAVEYWLNGTVFKAPVSVSQITVDRQGPTYTVQFNQQPKE